jgi:hypothetical protein
VVRASRADGDVAQDDNSMGTLAKIDRTRSQDFASVLPITSTKLVDPRARYTLRRAYQLASNLVAECVKEVFYGFGCAHAIAAIGRQIGCSRGRRRAVRGRRRRHFAAGLAASLVGGNCRRTVGRSRRSLLLGLLKRLDGATPTRWKEHPHRAGQWTWLLQLGARRTRIGRELVPLATEDVRRGLDGLGEIVVKAREHFELAIEVFDVPTKWRHDRARCLCTTRSVVTRIEERADLFEWHSCFSEISHEQQTIELGALEQTMTTLGATDGSQNSCLFVEANGAQRIVWKARHLARRVPTITTPGAGVF